MAKTERIAPTRKRGRPLKSNKPYRYANNGFMPATQFKKLGIPDWLFEVYRIIAHRPTVTVRQIAEELDLTYTGAKQAIWKLRHMYRAVRPLHCHVVNDLRLGFMARRWAKTVRMCVPKEEYHLFFNEDGSREDDDTIHDASVKAAYNTHIITGEILRYLFSEGTVQLPAWEYWDFAKKLGCDMHLIKRPDEEKLKDACDANAEVRATGSRIKRKNVAGPLGGDGTGRTLAQHFTSEVVVPKFGKNTFNRHD